MLGPAAGPGVALSTREMEVLRLVATGLDDDDSAERLVLSQRTVHRHVANIRANLGVSPRTAAAATAPGRPWAYLGEPGPVDVPFVARRRKR